MSWLWRAIVYIDGRLDRIEGSQARIENALSDFPSTENLETIMKNLDEVLAQVTDQNTKTDSLIALVDGIKKQLDDALSGANLPPAVQAKVDAIFDLSAGEAAKVDQAITANTPPTPSGA